MNSVCTKVILGGHWGDAPGWEIFTEEQCDITRGLPFEDETLDAIFTEHVIEHVSFADAVFFFREAHRVLKPGGSLRTVFPSTEMGGADAAYVESSLRGRFPDEERALATLGLDLTADPDVFLRQSMYTMHGHRFIWSPQLMVQVLRRVGFSATYALTPGVPAGALNTALERCQRGHYAGCDYQTNQDVEPEDVYDPESSVVEAFK